MQMPVNSLVTCKGFFYKFEIDYVILYFFHKTGKSLRNAILATSNWLKHGTLELKDVRWERKESVIEIHRFLAMSHIWFLTSIDFY